MNLTGTKDLQASFEVITTRGETLLNIRLWLFDVSEGGVLTPRQQQFLLNFEEEDKTDQEDAVEREVELESLALLCKSVRSAKSSVGNSCNGHVCMHERGSEPMIIIEPVEKFQRNLWALQNELIVHRQIQGDRLVEPFLII